MIEAAETMQDALPELVVHPIVIHDEAKRQPVACVRICQRMPKVDADHSAQAGNDSRWGTLQSGSATPTPNASPAGNKERDSLAGTGLWSLRVQSAMDRLPLPKSQRLKPYRRLPRFVRAH